jgi:integrase
VTVIKEIASIGLRGAHARVWVEKLRSGREVVRIQHREGDRRITTSLPNTAENRRVAKATAEGIVDRLQRRGLKATERLTLHDVADRYVKSKLPEWRQATRINTQGKWKRILAIIPPRTFADLITPETLDELREIMRKSGRAPAQTAAHITQIKAAFTFAMSRKLLVENPIADYKVRLGKDDRPRSVAEYTPAEAAGIMASLDYRTMRAWRPWVAITLAGVLGMRQNALLYLEWRDVDLNARTVRWRPELDKLGRDRVQPLPRAAVFAFRIAKVWRGREEYDGRFVFPAVQRERRGDKPWTYQALVEQLHNAEDRAGVARKPYRGMHGLRRMVAKNVLARTGGDLNAAGEWIGDTDLRVLKDSYLKERPEELRALAGRMDVDVRNPKKAKPLQPSDNQSPTAGEATLLTH